MHDPAAAAASTPSLLLEHETEAADREAMHHEVPQMGFRPTIRLAKTRRTAVVDGWSLCVDDLAGMATGLARADSPTVRPIMRRAGFAARARMEADVRCRRGAHMSAEEPVRLRTLDGLHLAGTFVTPDAPDRAVVLVHGGGVTREEGGFFSRLAAGLADAGAASLRFDLRGHGESEGRQEDLTLVTILNDIRVALSKVQETAGAARLSLLGASFTGGVCACYAAKHPEVDRLVLLNPQLDYKQRTIDSRPYWHEDRLDDEAADRLRELGYIQFTPSLRHGYAMLNEAFWFKPLDVLGAIAAPTLLVHGTKDTFVPIEASRAALPLFRAEHRLVEIEGSQHGFAVHDDPQYLNPQSQEWQAFVIRTVVQWVAEDVPEPYRAAHSVSRS